LILTGGKTVCGGLLEKLPDATSSPSRTNATGCIGRPMQPRPTATRSYGSRRATTLHMRFIEGSSWRAGGILYHFILLRAFDIVDFF
jgi:hypothetical protein